MRTADPSPARYPAPTADLRLAGLSIVLPCLDEEENVVAAITEALRAGSRCADAVEVVVVDDGSRDETRARAEGVGARDQRVLVVGHEANRGYGAALRSGIDATRMPWVLLTDADLQFDLTELAGFLPAAVDHDLVAGYRRRRSDPLRRRVTASAWNALVRASLGVGLRDVDCAFKLVRGALLRELPLTCDGAMISTELAVRAQQARWRVVQRGVAHRPRRSGTPSGNAPHVVARAFRERRALARELRGEGRAPRPTGLRRAAGA